MKPKQLVCRQILENAFIPQGKYHNSFNYALCTTPLRHFIDKLEKAKIQTTTKTTPKFNIFQLVQFITKLEWKLVLRYIKNSVHAISQLTDKNAYDKNSCNQ